ncbi:hypothetical protein TrVE_jg4228 [Triparma verrucosa]|uniref:Uncharacterized protein n=1 Tax=Triparma verrucosa TaxID=1606542 RepID=A0A9W6ZES0_9STRA|nr:hypothetical protein TrVE_jg4228 [Triparma verrucosa]
MPSDTLSYSQSLPGLLKPTSAFPSSKSRPPPNPNAHGKTFTAAPEGYNQAPRFSTMHRDSNSSNGLFLGSPFSMTQAGPGSYPGIDKSTLTPAGPSKTRMQTMNRRLRDCRPLTGSAATLSLYGADRMLQKEVIPVPGKLPESSFKSAQEKKGYCSSVFASEASRFIPTRELGKGLLREFGVHSPRKYKRVLPKKGFNDDGIKIVDERSKRREMRKKILHEQAELAKTKKAAKEAKKEKERAKKLEQTKRQQGSLNSATVIKPFDGTIDWAKITNLDVKEEDPVDFMPKAAQFTTFDSWKKNSSMIVFDDDSYINIRPWTQSSHISLPQTARSTNSVRFEAGEEMRFSRGGMYSRGEDGSLTANSASSDTVRFKEKRTMKYPWMKVMFKEVVSKDQKLDIENVESLESFKPPNTKSMRFY